MTYFILYHLDVVRRAIDKLHAHIASRTKESQQLQEMLRGSAQLNPRQIALLSHALRHPKAEYSVKSHQASHRTVPQTAREDLNSLANRNLLAKYKVGRTYFFRPVKNLEARLRHLD